MQVLKIATAVSAAAVAAQTGVLLSGATPFQAGYTQVGIISYNSGTTGTPVVKLQTSPDNATWTDVLVGDGSSSEQVGQIVLDTYIRTNVTTAGTAGTFDAYIVGSV